MSLFRKTSFKTPKPSLIYIPTVSFIITPDLTPSLFVIGVSQAKKKHYDTELEYLEKHQKQTIEKMESDHAVKLKEETKRIKAEQEREYQRFQEMVKHHKKEVCTKSLTS